MSIYKALIVFGTRPEAIKLAPLIKLLDRDENFNISVCNTGQHMEMLKSILDFFNIKPKYNLRIMQNNQSLYDITVKVLRRLEKVLEDERPDIVIVQGDTTTTFASALAAFYKKIKIAHIEAGLRSFKKYSPYPEEMNRVLVSRLVDYHFAPTEKAKQNLIMEGIKENVWVVGNTVIDAMFLCLNIIKGKEDDGFYSYFKNIDFSKKIILVTSHRRENFGKKFINICLSLKDIVNSFRDIEIVYPVHLNPNVKQIAYELLKDEPSIHLLEPLDYPKLIWLLSKAYIVLTDSGGIQEEAPSLGKPVVVLRDVTERIEGLEAGTAILAGTDRKRIVNITSRLLACKEYYEKVSKATNPYGDGKASLRIIDILKKVLSSPRKKLEE